MTSQIESDGFVHLDKQYYQERVTELFSPFFHQFNKIIRGAFLFNLAFLALGFIEICLFVLFFAFLAKSAILALSLGLIFLTAFCYAVLRIYFQAKKPEQLIDLKNGFLSECSCFMQIQELTVDHHLAISNAICKLASKLYGREYQCYPMPQKLSFLSPIFQKFSGWCHWQDVQKMKEILLEAAIDEHLKMIEIEPTNLEVHASLANVYVMLSHVYCDPRKQEGQEEASWLPSGTASMEMHQKFQEAAHRAVEEFKILKDFAPDDPWVHSQLAYSYHDLQMHREEIQEYEILLRLQPEDKDTLFKLGVLYFEHGYNAKGLQIYEALKQTNYKRAENLIKFYAAYSRSSTKQ